jgi:hypothetical protein
LTGGPSVEDQTLEGPIVRREDGMHCQLLSHFSDNEFVNPNSLKEPRNHPANYYPAGGLPADSVLVVKTSALRDLEERLAEPDHKIEACRTARAHVPVGIIAALAELAKLDVTKPSSAAVAIESQTVRMGVRVAARTIENHLKLIPEVLERLSK